MSHSRKDNRIVLSYPAPKLPKVFTYFKRKRETSERNLQTWRMPAHEKVLKDGWIVTSETGSKGLYSVTYSYTKNNQKAKIVPSLHKLPKPIESIQGTSHIYAPSRLKEILLDPLQAVIPREKKITRRNKMAFMTLRESFNLYKENPRLLRSHIREEIRYRRLNRQRSYDQAIFV